MHNLRTQQEDLLAILAELEVNAKYLSSRKGGVILCHEIISFHEEGRDHLNPRIFADLAKTYLCLRVPNALGFAKAHYDQSHPHIHFIISANELRSGKKLRLSKAQFAQIKKQVDRYQREKYPELAKRLFFERGR